MSTLQIEMVDPLTGKIEHTGPIEDYREKNSEDEDTLDVLDRIERGEITQELVGFYLLRKGGES